ncbi:Poly [ADP-ribose] polymerase 14 [Stylophora pistillata]|uniref:Poly [ADP-ribose] polymerase n=1 Tax=Stylophora pistillata TaxID=50429 RepID=A0A2B4REH4_STYPI|nr:Poly [ADP-ribose] polymerase 14 [Stylophora pistillata]
MARRKNFLYDAIKKELECSLCQEQFTETNQPKVVICQHTFCESCLQRRLRRQIGKGLSCPNCGVITECPNNNIDRLPSNLAHKRLRDILEAHGGSDRGLINLESKEQNFCKRHEVLVKFYCEQCEICICSECAIVEHRDPIDHTIMSLEDGAKKQRASIQSRLRDIEENSSLLKNHFESLNERKAKYNNSIDKVAAEVRSVTEGVINVLRQHEETMTDKLAKEKSLYGEAMKNEMSKLVEKLRLMYKSTRQGREVLQTNDVRKLLDVKHQLDGTVAERFQNSTPLLRSSSSSSSSSCLFVQAGQGLTESIQGEVGYFTVTTKDSSGKTTYSEIDNVTVEITSVRQGTKNIPVLVKDLKDGRYCVSYTPRAVGDFKVSIKVRDDPINGSPFHLVVARKPKPVFSKFHDVILPSNWIPQPKNRQGEELTVHLVELNPVYDAQEYQEVQNHTRKMCHSKIMILRIARVQNPALYRTYAMRKQKKDKEKGSNEQRLFLGIPGSKCQQINETGFCLFQNKKAPTDMYGKGLYFVKDALHPAQSSFSPPDNDGHRYMYLSRVLVGECTVGREGMVTPPKKNQSDSKESFDCVVNQIPDPNVFVIFYEGQFYPEYLITFS